MTWDLRLGAYEDVLQDVEVDLVCTDPPYSARVHKGHDTGAGLANKANGWHRKSAGRPDVARPRRELNYEAWTEEEIAHFMEFWAPRCRGWFAVLSDSELCPVWRDYFEQHRLTGFHPLPCVMPGMTVRMSGDGPSSWAIYANVARPKALHTWGTLRGAYIGSPGTKEKIVTGGKPLWLMRELVSDYSRPGDLVCDPCAGGATTLLAASIEGRRSVGAEVDPKTYEKARRRLAGVPAEPDERQTTLF